MAFHWVPCSTRSSFPQSAVVGGNDNDGTTIYVGRAYHDGDWIPAKVMPAKNISYICYGGKEHPKEEFEILCEQRFDWVPTSGSNVPHNAVEGGRTSDGETLYVGRAFHEGSHTVGKVQPSHGVCYIPFGGDELHYDQYEVLVLRD